MRIRQLGNGGAFHFKQINTSFLISLDNYDDGDVDNGTKLLFDCGRNVVDKLDELAEKEEFNYSNLKYVYISHMDDDHIGSLKSLIYYMFFSIGKKIIILSNPKVSESLKVYLKDLDGFFENFNKIDEMLFNFIEVPLNASIQIDNGVMISALEAKHSIPCAGLKLSSEDGTIYLPGDSMEVFINIEARNKPFVVFQDYSLWDNPGSQVHCCKAKFMKESLSSYFDDYNGIGNVVKSTYRSVKLCHTGLEFNDQWMTIEEASNMEDKIMLGLKKDFEAKFEKDKTILLRVATQSR